MQSNPFQHLSVVLKLNDAASDAELLRRFADTGDRSAFELVVRRHAELVWSVCRAVLPHDTHAAEDAFQATFLALARKATSVHGECATGWLFRVARNAAVRVRTRAARRESAPLPDSLPDAGVTVDDASAWRELAPIVAEEIDRLSAALRDPVVLCFFEGYTHIEAATRLGWPVGTVASRLARAKDLLRDRLTRRGVVFPTAGLAAIFAGSSVTAERIQTALAMATGPASDIPPAVHSLTNGVLSTMRFTKLKLGAAFTFVIVVGLSVAYAALPAREPQQPNKTPVVTIPLAQLPRQVADKKSDEERLKPFQGKWRIVEEKGGPNEDNNPNPYQKLNNFAQEVITVEKDKFSLNGPLAASAVSFDLRFPEKATATDIDFVYDDNMTVPAIYKLEGGRLVICARDEEHLKKGRPKDFTADKTQGIMILERVRDEKAERKAMTGEWEGQRIIINENMIIVADENKQLNWTFDGKEITMSGKGELGEKATIKLDPSATPPSIEMTITKGDAKGTKLEGVYVFQEDKLTISFFDPNVLPAERPNYIQPDPKVIYFELERKPKK